MIPPEAIEAAARMSQALHFAEPWESLSDYLRGERLREAELILEAAAPHLASAWHEQQVPKEAPHKITIDKLGDDGHGKLMSLISDIMAINGRAVVYVYPELKDAK